MALSAAVQEALWWHGIKCQITDNHEAMKIFVDNQSAIALAENGGFHARTKHIDIRHHFIQDELNKGEVELVYIPTCDNTADVLTKPLNKQKQKLFTSNLGLRAGVMKG